MRGSSSYQIGAVIILYCIQGCLSTLVSVKINQLGYSFTVPITVNSVSQNYIIDTGNFDLTQITGHLKYNNSISKACLSLSEDSTSVYFLGNCTTVQQSIKIGTAFATVPITVNQNIVIQNPNLHDWITANGDLGLAFPQCSNKPCLEETPFQYLVQDVSLKSQTTKIVNGTPVVTTVYYDYYFGLDFNPTGSPFTSINNVSSTMQIGGVEPKYKNSLTWLAQPAPVGYLTYFEFFMNNLEFCDANVLSPYGTNWQVLIDTGSSCMTLPGEIYNSVISYFDNTTFVDTELQNMPAFSFSTLFNFANNATNFYVPLSALIINSSAIEMESGAPYISILNSVTGNVEQYRLCLIQGDFLENTFTGNYVSPPFIVLGSLALSAIYMAGDYTNGYVGLANKLTSTEISYFNSTNVKGCKPIAVCIGDQRYDEQYNLCKDPKCSDYFFVNMDSDTKTCVYKVGDMAFGLFVIIAIILVEVCSYFVVQYSAYVSVTQHNRENKNWREMLQRGLDPFTLIVGRMFCLLLDPILIALKWVPSTVTVVPQNASTRGLNISPLGPRDERRPESPRNEVAPRRVAL